MTPSSLYIGVYVDNIVLAGKNQQTINNVKQEGSGIAEPFSGYFNHTKPKQHVFTHVAAGRLIVLVVVATVQPGTSVCVHKERTLAGNAM